MNLKYLPFGFVIFVGICSLLAAADKSAISAANAAAIMNPNPIQQMPSNGLVVGSTIGVLAAAGLLFGAGVALNSFNMPDSEGITISSPNRSPRKKGTMKDEELKKSKVMETVVDNGSSQPAKLINVENRPVMSSNTIPSNARHWKTIQAHVLTSKVFKK